MLFIYHYYFGQILCFDVVLEDTDISKAITEYAAHAAIESLVLGSSRHGFIRWRSHNYSTHIPASFLTDYMNLLYKCQKSIFTLVSTDVCIIYLNKNYVWCYNFRRALIENCLYVVQEIEDGRCSDQCVKRITRLLHCLCYLENKDFICSKCFPYGTIHFPSYAPVTEHGGAGQ